MSTEIDLSTVNEEEISEKLKLEEIESESFENMFELNEFNYMINIKDEKYNITVFYYATDELPELLAFEGTRIAALIKRGISLPTVEERVWDKKRKITVSHR